MMAERLGGRRERVLASSLARDAWADSDAARSDAKLAMSNLTACDIVCERRATGQALQHLLREALARTPASGTVEIRGRRRGGARSIEIKVVNGSGAAEVRRPHNRPEGSPRTPDSSLRVMLARLLLEMQGATLSLWDNGEAGIWYGLRRVSPAGLASACGLIVGLLLIRLVERVLPRPPHLPPAHELTALVARQTLCDLGVELVDRLARLLIGREQSCLGRLVAGGVELVGREHLEQLLTRLAQIAAQRAHDAPLLLGAGPHVLAALCRQRAGVAQKIGQKRAHCLLP